MTCPSVYTAAAAVDVKSNGGAGTVTLNWIYENSDHVITKVGNPVVVSLVAGKTDQSLAPSTFDFSKYEDFFPSWGIEIVTSSPAAQSVGAPQLLTSQTNCQPVIQ